MQVIEYFEVGDDFSEDGRGNNYKVIANFLNEGNAEYYAQNHGNYGSAARVIPKTLIICETLDDVKQADKTLIKMNALSKLTDEEKKVLGLCE